MSLFSTKTTRPPLEDIPYEKFLRLAGLYAATPAQIKTAPPYRAAVGEFERQKEELEKCIDPETGYFKGGDASDRVHNLNILLLQFVPREFLAFLIGALRDDYRDTVDDATYRSYLDTPAFRALNAATYNDASNELLVRADATFLCSETRRFMLLRGHVQETRRFLIDAVTKFAVRLAIPLGALVLLFFLSYHIFHLTDARGPMAWLQKLLVNSAVPDSPEPSPIYKTVQELTILALAGIAGAAGSYVSVLSRIEAVDETTQVSRNIWTLRNSETAVRLAPLSGVLFAIVLSFLLAGGLISGSLFPKVYDSWYLVLYHPQELAKWIVWAFISGFSERMVPDMIDRLVKAKDDPKTSSSVPPVNPAPVTPPTDSGGGAGSTAPGPGNASAAQDLPPSRLQPDASGS